MIRKLFIIAGAGFILSLVCLAGTAVLVRDDLKGEGFTFTNREMDGPWHISRSVKTSPQPQITKTLEFKPADLLGIDVPAEVSFTQGPAPSLMISGSKDLVERVRYSEGRLYLTPGDKVANSFNLKLNGNKIEANQVGGLLKITVTAPAIKRFDITGAGDLKINAYDQPELSLNISGAGKIEAEGRTKSLRLDISGVGNADLEGLEATDADVHISGMGDADIAATGAVKTDISGTGNIRLVKRPTSLEKRVSGLGTIKEDE